MYVNSPLAIVGMVWSIKDKEKEKQPSSKESPSSSQGYYVRTNGGHQRCDLAMTAAFPEPSVIVAIISVATTISMRIFELSIHFHHFICSQ